MPTYLEALDRVLEKQQLPNQNGTGQKDLASQPVVPTEEERQRWLKDQQSEVLYLDGNGITKAFELIALGLRLKGLDANATVTKPSQEKPQPVSIVLEYGYKKVLAPHASSPAISHTITLSVARENGQISGVRFPISTDPAKILPPDPELIGGKVVETYKKSFEEPTPQKPTVYMPDLAMV